MKKLFVVLFLFLSVSAFSEKFNGVFGFNFGMTQEQCEKVSDDYIINKSFGNEENFMSVEFNKNVTYGSCDVMNILLKFKYNKLFSITINYSEPNWNWRELKTAFNTKYENLENILIEETSVFRFTITDIELKQSLNNQIEQNKLKPIIDDI